MITLSEVCRPLPSAVPPPGWRRSIAASTLARSAVGCWVTSPLLPNATTPTRTVGGWRSTTVRAAAFAASIRVGVRSVAVMLDDTSNASIIVPSRRGSGTPISGRASAASSSTTALSSSAGGRERFQPALGAGPASPSAASSARRAARARTCRRYQSTRKGTAASARSPHGHAKVNIAPPSAHAGAGA